MEVITQQITEESVESVKIGVAKDAQYWHDQGVKANEARSSSSIEHAESLYQLSQGGYKDLGYESFAEYVYVNFNKSLKWAEKLIGLHKKFIVTLGKTKEDLKQVGFGKVSKLQSIVTEENVDNLLSESLNLTQGQIDAKIKESKGLASNEVEAKDDKTTLKFTGLKTDMVGIKQALELAKEDFRKSNNTQSVGIQQVSDFHALEYMAVNYSLSRDDITGDRETILAEKLAIIERAQGIKITWEEDSEWSANE